MARIGETFTIRRHQEFPSSTLTVTYINERVFCIRVLGISIKTLIQ